MRILLCHNCWSWVQFDADVCPDCHHPVDLSDPDPPLAELDRMFGAMTCQLATVRCERRSLPSQGVLLGVSGGLLFLPELSQLPNGAMSGPEEEHERHWSLPKWFSLWGRRPEPVATTIMEPAFDVTQRADRFLDSPGAVFVPCGRLIRADLRGRTWTIHRTVGPTLRFTMLSPAEQARQAWREFLVRDPAWRELAAMR